MKAAYHPPARARVLVVEDCSVFREMQALLLRQAGFGVWSFENPAAALTEAATQRFELALVDYELPGMTGEQFMHAIWSILPGLPVIFVSGSLTLERVSALTRQGAAGIFSKPANPKILLDKIRETLNRVAEEAELRAGAHLQTGVSHVPFPVPEPSADRLAYEPVHFHGASEIFLQFTHRLWRVRDFRTVLLLLGEPGSPFELVARELARLSIFRSGPVLVCSREEFEPQRLSELLATSLLTPEPGTLILHGVEEFSHVQQTLLADLLAMRGMFQPFARRFRLLASATPILQQRVEAGAFDEALFYKLGSLSLTVPALADMRGDLAINSTRILEHFSATARLTAEAAAWIEDQTWPGNYEQLSGTLLCAARIASGAPIGVATLEAGALTYANEQVARAQASPLPAASIEADVEHTPSPDRLVPQAASGGARVVPR